jgi:putative MATE family efflux protein
MLKIGAQRAFKNCPKFCTIGPVIHGGKKMEHSLTKGKILPSLLGFTIPYLLASFLQTFYGMADLFIVGQFCSTANVNAVSLGSQLMHMLTVMIVGLAMGCTVRVSNYIGAKQKENIPGVVQNTLYLFALIALISMVLLFGLTSPIVSLLQTPAEAVPYCTDYLRICFLGLPFIIFYNVAASIYRGLGDSRSPMYFVFLSSIINIALDYLFVGPLGMQAAGAALATVIAQGLSALLAFVFLPRLHKEVQLFEKREKIDLAKMRDLLTLGGPISLQDGFIQVSFMVITLIANTRGLVFSTGVGISEKIISFLFLVPSAFLASLSAAVAQNEGAKKHDRSKKMLQAGLILSMSYGLLCCLFCQVFASNILSLFVHNKDVITSGAGYLRSYSLDCIFAACQFCFSGYFAGIGRPSYSFIHNVVSVLAVRIPGSYLASVLFAQVLWPMGLAAPAGSLLSSLICLGFYFYEEKRRKNQPALSLKQA